MQYVKLGEKASMFYDPTTQVKVMPGMAVGITNREKESKKFKRAVAAGHLEKISKDDADALNTKTIARAAKLNAKADTKKAASAPSEDTDEKEVSKMNKSELIAKAVDMGKGTEEDLDDMTKKELVVLIESEDEDEEEEEEDEDTDDEDED